jgi:hypothetical protein
MHDKSDADNSCKIKNEVSKCSVSIGSFLEKNMNKVNGDSYDNEVKNYQQLPVGNVFHRE